MLIFISFSFAEKFGFLFLNFLKYFNQCLIRVFIFNALSHL